MNIHLTGKLGGTMLLDDADAPLVVCHRIWQTPKGYAMLWAAGRNIMVHRLLLGEPAGAIDHVNGDKLDNRRANLRLATPAQNSFNVRARKNASGFKGVTKNTQGWIARIQYDGRQRNLGTYATPEDAAKAYDRAAAVLFGEFAKLNF